MGDNHKGYKSVELPTSVPGIGYTLRHRETVMLLITHFCKNAVGKIDGNGQPFTQQDYTIMRNRGKCHDMDKVLMSLSYPQLTADYFHRIFNGHHEESMINPNQKSKYDWMEMLFDMESAKYTKPDKQGGGAFAFARKFKPYVFQFLLPYFQLFGLDKENPGMITEIKEAVTRKYYETDLIDTILEYIHTTRLHLLDGVSRIDDKGYMQGYGKPAPFRHPSTQTPKGIYHQRPTAVCNHRRSIMSREMIHGTIEAQMFDMDRLCLLGAEDVKNINKQALNVVKDMGQKGLQR